MTSFSSWGPTDDGRIKPDVSAPGCQSDEDNGVTSTWDDGGYGTICGTSMASPTVCGLSALILEDFKALYPGEPLPRNSTLKILLAHNAVDLGNTGPDYKFGYGSVRVNDTIDFMRNGGFLEDSVDQGEDKVFLVHILPGVLSLKATLAWDDPPGAINTIPELVNDLDVVVISPNSVTVHYPWTLDPSNGDAAAVRTQADCTNNIEQVVVDNPESGVWTIRVRGYSVPSGPQVFSLATTPKVETCSAAGVILLDAEVYSCSGTAQVTVVDCNLNVDPCAVESITVDVNSTTELAGENVLLTETDANSAKFFGTVELSETNAPDILEVSHGDTITAFYNDANDGTGGAKVVQDNAAVDCVAPVISNIQMSNIMGQSATVSFDTNEPAYGTVRYGLSCGSLTDTAAGEGCSQNCVHTSHSVTLSGLVPNTTYFYVVDAEDSTGNLSTDSNDGNCHAFTTHEMADNFTELFEAGDNDLDNLTMTFIPDGSISFYRACTEEAIAFPTDPSGGTSLPLGDDSSALVPLSAMTVLLYGESYGDGEVWAGSNGYLTFGAGDTDYTESLADHFDLPRISALFDDLDPSAGGMVSWKQLGDRIAVTWENIPEYDRSNSNNFQVEMFFDGMIRITWLAVAATDGLAGLSEGFWMPMDFLESDLSAYGSCDPRPPTAHDVSVNTKTNVPAEIDLPAFDDSLPDPPGALTYRILSLPSDGNLSDPCAGAIISAPYVLAGGGSTVTYTPDSEYEGPDIFTFDANDGGIEPNGGVSNVATVSITVIDCRPDEPNSPDPPIGANDVPIDTNLSWSAGGDMLLLGLQSSTSNTASEAYIRESQPSIFRAAGQAYGKFSSKTTAETSVPGITALPPSPKTDEGNLIINGDFETGDLSGWTLVDSGDGTFVINDGTFDPGGPDGPLATYNGSFSALSNQDAPGVHTIYQDVTLHASTTLATLAWADMIRNHAGEFSDPDQEFRVEIWNTDNEVLATLFSTNPGDPLLNSWTERSADISQFAGMTIRVAFTEEDNHFYFNVHLDDIRIELLGTTYDVYFGTGNPPTELICSDVNEPNCNPGPLELCTPYYWQVIAKNSCGQRSGEIWSFTTESFPGDFEPDCDVDFADVAVIVEQWLQVPGSPSADIAPPPAGDGIVNFKDFALLANQWLNTNPCVPDDMVYIPDGEFEMGDHHGDGDSNELPPHAVLLDSFLMSKFEITNQQYCDALNSGYDAGKIKVDGGIVYKSSDSSNLYPYCDTHSSDADSQIDFNDVSGTFSVRTKGGRDMSNDPMVQVSWCGAAAYCNWRSRQEGYEVCHNPSTWECDFSKHGYRLPTEAEWEYAARGGNPYYRFPWGDTISHSQANYHADPCSYPYDVSPTSGFHPDWDDGIFPYTAPVGSFSANGYGLYDMTSNVWEWCNDWYDSNYYSASPYDNPQGPASDTSRVLRGGSWSSAAGNCRVAHRLSNVPDFRYFNRGFRIVLDLN
jgi:formylglycine-generating enzyme required for sulfatase activity